MKYRLEFKYGFTNRGRLHCATLKTLHGCKEKRAKSKRYEIFPPKFSKRDFQDFENV